MKDLVRWDRDEIMKERLEHLIDTEGKYLGRPLITMDSPVLGGIHVGTKQREAIVVDTKYGELVKLYETIKDDLAHNGKLFKQLLLGAVYDAVAKAMPIRDDKKIDSLVRGHSTGKDQKVALDLFISEGIGSYVHGALACAALLEMFQKKGLIGGKASVDSNTLKADNRERTWCRYMNSGNMRYILDVKGCICNSLHNTMGRHIWPYARPDDKVTWQ